MDSDSPLQKGRRFLESGDLASAKAEFEKALEKDPGNAENHNSLGLVALQENRLVPDAEAHFRKAIELNPKDSAYPFNLGLTYARLNRFDDAEPLFKSSLEINPQYGPARWGLGNIYFAQRRWDDSKNEYLKLYQGARIDPELNNQLGRIALAQGQNDIAEGYFRVSIEHAQKDSAWIYLGNLGLSLKYRGRYEEAAKAFLESLAAKPGETYTLVNVGECQFSLGRFDDAKGSFQEALQHSPNDDQIENWLGRIGLATGNVEDAERMFRNAFAHNPNEPAYPTNLALALMRKGNVADAEYQLNWVLGKSPEYYPAQVDLGSLYFEKNDFEKARAQFEAALPKAKDGAEASGGILNWLGRTALGLGQLEAARDYFLSAARANPKEPVYQVNLALTLAKQSKIEEAKAAYERALAIDAGNELAHFGLGSIYFDEGRLDAAKTEFDLALPRGERNPDLYLWLGRIALAQAKAAAGDGKGTFYEQAREAYLKAVDLNRNSLPARSGLGSVYLAQEQFAKARSEFAQVIQLDPADAEGHQGLGRVAMGLEDYGRAEEEFLRCIELDSQKKLPSARLYLGSLLSGQERYAEALEHLNEFVRLDPRNVEGYFQLGRLYFLQKKFTRAREHQIKACSLRPNNPREERELARTLVEMERFEDAESRLHALLARGFPAGEGRSEIIRGINQTLAHLYYRWGKAAGDSLFFHSGLEALDLARNATRADDALILGEIYCMRGILNCHRKQYATAQRDFERSIEYFEIDSRQAGGNGRDPTYYVAARNLERLRESFALVGGIDPIWLKRLSITLAALSAVQLVLLWCLFLAHWSGISPKMFATLNPVFFGMILLSLLLPQLSKFKLGGITAEVAKPEQIQGIKLDVEDSNMNRGTGFDGSAFRGTGRSGAIPLEGASDTGLEYAKKGPAVAPGGNRGAGQR